MTALCSRRCLPGSICAALVLALATALPVVAQKQTATFEIGKATDVRAYKVALSSDGKMLAAIVDGSADDGGRGGKCIRIWDIKTRKDLARLRTDEGGIGHLFAFTPDGAHLVCS